MSEVDDVIKGFNAAMVRVDDRRKAKELEAAKKPKAPVVMDPDRIKEIRDRRWLRQYMLWF